MLLLSGFSLENDTLLSCDLQWRLMLLDGIVERLGLDRFCMLIFVALLFALIVAKRRCRLPLFDLSRGQLNLVIFALTTTHYVHSVIDFGEVA